MAISEEHELFHVCPDMADIEIQHINQMFQTNRCSAAPNGQGIFAFVSPMTSNTAGRSDSLDAISEPLNNGNAGDESISATAGGNEVEDVAGARVSRVARTLHPLRSWSVWRPSRSPFESIAPEQDEKLPTRRRLLGNAQKGLPSRSKSR